MFLASKIVVLSNKLANTVVTPEQRYQIDSKRLGFDENITFIYLFFTMIH